MIQIILISLQILCIRGINGYLLSNSSHDMLYLHTLLLNDNGYPNPNITCATDRECYKYNAVCGKSGMCECRPFYQFDDLGYCVDCPEENHYCGYNNCCGGNLLVCYYGVCRQCMVDPISMNCITREQLMYATLSQISLALAMVLGILALLTLLYKACKRPSLMFGRSQRLGGNRRDVSTIEDLSRASISSTQRRVLTQMQDRPPRYEREQSNATTTTTIASNNPPPTPTHVLGEPPPLYCETGNTPTENQLEPPPAYSESFPTISTVSFICTGGIDEEVKDEVGSASDVKKDSENKTISVTTTTTSSDK